MQIHLAVSHRALINLLINLCAFACAAFLVSDAWAASTEKILHTFTSWRRSLSDWHFGFRQRR